MFLKLINSRGKYSPMTSKIEELWKQALTTFTGCRKPDFQLCRANLERLKILMCGITAKDVYINNEVLDIVKDQRAPMAVIDIFKNQDIFIGVFLLKQNITLPIHDHPKMHGFLKVISGKVKVDSFTLDTTSLDYKIDGMIVTSCKHPTETVHKDDPPCILEPHLKNLHCVKCIEGPAAFLDVISPTYYSEDCLYPSYFEIVHEDEKSDKVELLVIEYPPNFYSRNLRYLGPSLSDQDS